LGGHQPFPRRAVRSQGVEFDALGKITNELSVIASYGSTSICTAPEACGCGRRC
jgi:hypothetical protein